MNPNELAKKLEELAEEIKDGGEEGLPKFNGWQMQELLFEEPYNDFAIYKDEDGDVWLSQDDWSYCIHNHVDEILAAVEVNKE